MKRSKAEHLIGWLALSLITLGHATPPNAKPPHATPPNSQVQLTIKASGGARIPGQPLTLKCSILNADEELLDSLDEAPFNWYLNGTLVNDSTGYHINSLNTGWTTLDITMLSQRDIGQFVCAIEVPDTQGEAHYRTHFDVNFDPVVSIEPSDQDVGKDVTFSCSIHTGKNSELDWFFTNISGGVLTSTQYKKKYNHRQKLDSGIIMMDLIAVRQEQAGIYTCYRDDDLERSSNKTLTVQVMLLEVNCKTPIQVWEGSDVIIQCDIMTDINISIRDCNFLIDEKTIIPRINTSLEKWDKWWRLTITITKVPIQVDQKILRVFVRNVSYDVRLTVGHKPCSECEVNKHCVSDRCICKPGFIPNLDVCLPGNVKGAADRAEDSKKMPPLAHKAAVSIPTVVGSTLGALGVVLVALIIFVCYRRMRKKHKLKMQAPNVHYTDPSYMYQYEYHSEANLIKDNPTVHNQGYETAPKRSVRKENTYISMKTDKLEFPRENLQLGVDLGQGRFGKVIQAQAMNITGSCNWERVAVKTCRGTATDTEKQDLYSELEIMRKIPTHPNVVGLYGCCSKIEPLYIILEYVQRGSLMDYLRRCRPSSRMSNGSMLSMSSSSSFMQPRAKDLTIFALQIARGMAHIASCGIIHRDLAARNVLLATDFTCKICDFGLARDVEGIDVYERTSKGPLPIRWMAPEALADNMYTTKSDVWSYGILLWEIVTLGATPYSGKSAMEVMRLVMQGQYLPRPLHCKEEMYMLMEKCWCKPNERPSFADIVTHHEALMDDDYIMLSDYEESDYGWLDSYTTDERL
ncbi:fibroblast growth factor receptor 3-like isoform X2 [Dreissena polymorpha]|uniref:fibroblast growth factor receptor 3-like isoform X2 n=1 Tax=Dreissena polymorpha TaxID=45954 RepID=UPI002263DBC0|nr:fibroblast growth factor receptor 3-like isoform X2 [Dreissena polymorpha]